MNPHGPGADASTSNPGGAMVADLRSMDDLQALAVLTMRDWFDGADGRERVAGLFADALDPPAGRAALEAWAELGDLISDGTRRPVMRHAVSCRCVGADEAVIAQVLALAGCGEREDAMLILSLLVIGDRLLPAIHIAERAGLALMRVRLARTRPSTAPTTSTLH